MSGDTIRDEYGPSPADLLSTPEVRERFAEKSSALEAADLVRRMRRVALSATGARGISQSELAQRTGLSQPRISQIEKASGRDGITYAVLRKIAYACGMDWGEMLRGAIAARASLQGPRGGEKAPFGSDPTSSARSRRSVGGLPWNEPGNLSTASEPMQPMSIDDLLRQRRRHARGRFATSETPEPEIPRAQLPKE